MYQRHGARPDQGSGSTTSLYLSLYLIVLAFFIVLNAVSHREQGRASAVLGSIGASFSEPASPATGSLESGRGPGAFAAVDQFETAVREVFEAALPLVVVTPNQPFQQMILEVPSDAVFAPASASIRADGSGLINRLAKILGRDDPGQRFAVEALLVAPAGEPIAAGGVAAARAGALARALEAGGVPPHRISAGVTEGDVPVLRLSFFVEPVGEAGAPIPPAED